MTDESKKDLFDALAKLEEIQGESGGWPTSPRYIGGYRLECTCPACPEQYEVFDATGRQVGYLRLRDGWFRADAPQCGSETVYEAHTEGDGIFAEHERQRYLSEAVAAIDRHIHRIKDA